MTTRPVDDLADSEWDDLLSDYEEWYEATVARLGGEDKFLFRVAHRARRIDPLAERPALWTAPMFRLSRDDLMSSARGWATSTLEGSRRAVPSADPVIRSAVTMLLEGTDRSALTPGASRWGSAEDLVGTITSRPEYAGHFGECSAPRSSPGKWCSGWILQVRWFRRSGRWSAVRGWSPPGRLPGW